MSGWRLFPILAISIFLGCTKRTATDPTPANSAKANSPATQAQISPAEKQQGTQQATRPQAATSTEPTPPSVAAPSAQSRFTEITETAEVDFSYSNGRPAAEFAIIESLGGGLGIFDFDLDGRADLMFAGGGQLNNKTVTSAPSALFRNLSGNQGIRFRECTQRSHTTAAKYFTHGIYPGDLDGDGFDDLAISGYGGVQLLMNMGDGTFESLPSLVTNSTNAWSSSLAWADLDNNGHLDLYVAHYVDWSWQKHPICPGQGGVEREVCAPREFAGIQDVVYLNDGDLHLSPVAEEIGLLDKGKGLGVLVGDINADGFVDIYVANDTTDNFLYLNDGHGKFSESAIIAGVSGDDAGVSTGSMGLCLLDADGDRQADIFVTNFERELSALYRNEGQGYFTYASRQAGFAAYPAGSVGFGTTNLDFDFDGDQDLVVANGHVSYASPHAPYRQLPHLFENDRGHFLKLEGHGYFAETHTGRGVARGDFNNDGALDLAFSHLEEPVAILQSRSSPAANWAAIRLVGRQANRSGVGAVAELQAREYPQRQSVVGGGSYLSSNDRRLYFYWESESSPPRVLVEWPFGGKESFAIEPTRENVLVQGHGTVIQRDSSEETTESD